MTSNGASTIAGPAAGPSFADDRDDRYAIRVRRLQHYFGEGELNKQVLFDNDLEVARGEIVIMTGPSGSGKTTLLTLIGTLRTVQEGSLKVLGRELHGATPGELIALRRKIGFIFQAHNLFESLTALQNVRMALELFALDDEANADRGSEMLTRLGLGHRIHYKPGSLSGGQKQRVAIARGLVHRPKLDPGRRAHRGAGRKIGPRGGHALPGARQNRELHDHHRHPRQPHPRRGRPDRQPGRRADQVERAGEGVGADLRVPPGVPGVRAAHAQDPERNGRPHDVGAVRRRRDDHPARRPGRQVLRDPLGSGGHSGRFRRPARSWSPRWARAISSARRPC